MNVLKIIFAMIIVFFSLSFFLIGGWGIIALFYIIAYLILALTKFVNSSAKTNDLSKQLGKLSDLVSQKEIISKDEFDNMKAELGITK